MITARPNKWVLFNGVPVKQMAADDQGTQLDLTDFKIGSEGGMVLCQLLVRTHAAWVRFQRAAVARYFPRVQEAPRLKIEIHTSSVFDEDCHMNGRREGGLAVSMLRA